MPYWYLFKFIIIQNSLQRNQLRNHVKFIHGYGMDDLSIRELLDSMEL